jgi:predicted O-methyltransferase YrrM
MDAWIGKLFERPDLARMGHAQRRRDSNLGLGWLYYALGRIVRPRHAVVIGSYRGFVPMMLGKALTDNRDGGEVVFIDPSLVDPFWTDPAEVAGYFRQHGLDNVRHYRATTQQFVETDDYRAIGEVGILFIDGLHTDEQVAFDWGAFAHLVPPRGFIALHDSMVVLPDGVYGSDNAYEMRVKFFVDKLKTDPDLQVMDWPFGHSGLTLVRKIDRSLPDPLRAWIEGHPLDAV